MSLVILMKWVRIPVSDGRVTKHRSEYVGKPLNNHFFLRNFRERTLNGCSDIVCLKLHGSYESSLFAIHVVITLADLPKCFKYDEFL